MTQPFQTQNPEIDELFGRYRSAPQSTIFAPLADACRKAGMLEEALDICRKGLIANPGYASGYVVQGKCQYDADMPEKAEASFRRVLELDANNLVALKFIGIILSERGDLGAARACFEHILALDPEDRDIRRRLDEVGDRVRVTDVTITDELPEIPASVRPVQPVPAVPTVPAVRSEEDTGEFEGAPITLGEESGASDEIATITLADIYATQGYTEKARRIYREVLRRQPENEELKRKITALDSRPQEPVPAAGPVSEAPSSSASAAPAQREEEPASPRSTPAPRPSTGSQIDETRSYEQFKRWLRSVSD
jgi:tetratricopeptide (TPR) repeat protein